MQFSQFTLDAALLRGITRLGFTKPTPIQAAALPHALAGRDVLAAAMTGSGKTAAFALPALQRTFAGPTGRTRVLILTPTRELAAQVHEHLAAIGRETRVRVASVFGGVGAEPQARALRAGVTVVVATPGRLLDHLRSGAARLDGVELLVLDEADRMLDMGFLPDVRRILAHLPARRQTLMFSATLPPPIVELSRSLLSDPVRIGIERRAEPAKGVRQALLPVPEQRKPALLLQLLSSNEVDTALVFTRTKHRADRLARFLDQSGISCDRIHGNRSQPQRQSALAGFKAGKVRVLVATDIAARGIDVRDLPHVVNFDVPVQPDDYVHRVGRTARVEATGHALTLVTPEDEPAVRAIERAIGASIARRKVDGFNYSVPAAPTPSGASRPQARRGPIARQPRRRSGRRAA